MNRFKLKTYLWSLVLLGSTSLAQELDLKSLDSVYVEAKKRVLAARTQENKKNDSVYQIAEGAERFIQNQLALLLKEIGRLNHLLDDPTFEFEVEKKNKILEYRREIEKRKILLETEYAKLLQLRAESSPNKEAVDTQREKISGIRKEVTQLQDQQNQLSQQSLPAEEKKKVLQQTQTRLKEVRNTYDRFNQLAEKAKGYKNLASGQGTWSVELERQEASGRSSAAEPVQNSPSPSPSPALSRPGNEGAQAR